MKSPSYESKFNHRNKLYWQPSLRKLARFSRKLYIKKLIIHKKGDVLLKGTNIKGYRGV